MVEPRGSIEDGQSEIEKFEKALGVLKSLVDIPRLIHNAMANLRRRTTRRAVRIFVFGGR